LLINATNLGYCKTFNKAFGISTGSFCIDLAGDDVMMPERVEKQISFFENHTLELGVVFSDATYINDAGNFIRNHFEYLFRKKLITKIPQGDVYRDVLTTYFIPSPTMMIRKQVLDTLDGYDELLSYEDFDFWVRSSRLFTYGFINEPLTKIRRTGTSMSSGWYKSGDRQLHSTYLVCKKAIELNKDDQDIAALLVRIRYEIRQSIFSQNNQEARLFFELLKSLRSITLRDKFMQLVNFFKFPLRPLRTIYHRIRFE
jgi:glycosyltransferase involved in cell wall biosynthesis